VVDVGVDVDVVVDEVVDDEDEDDDGDGIEVVVDVDFVCVAILLTCLACFSTKMSINGVKIKMKMGNSVCIITGVTLIYSKEKHARLSFLTYTQLNSR